MTHDLHNSLTFRLRQSAGWCRSRVGIVGMPCAMLMGTNSHSLSAHAGLVATL